MEILTVSTVQTVPVAMASTVVGRNTSSNWKSFPVLMTKAARTWDMVTFAALTRAEEIQPFQAFAATKTPTHHLQQQQLLPLQPLIALLKRMQLVAHMAYVHRFSPSWWSRLLCLWGNRWLRHDQAVLKVMDWISNEWFQESPKGFNDFQKQWHSCHWAAKAVI